MRCFSDETISKHLKRKHSQPTPRSLVVARSLFIISPTNLSSTFLIHSTYDFVKRKCKICCRKQACFLISVACRTIFVLPNNNAYLNGYSFGTMINFARTVSYGHSVSYKLSVPTVNSI